MSGKKQQPTWDWDLCQVSYLARTSPDLTTQRAATSLQDMLIQSVSAEIWEIPVTVPPTDMTAMTIPLSTTLQVQRTLFNV